jgi:hypothetical protein
MTATIFSQGDIASWERALDSRPKAVTELEWPHLPQIEAFAPTALSADMAFGFRGRDQTEQAFIINPVAARHLAACIFAMGNEAGWLDGTGNVICPALPPLDS